MFIRERETKILENLLIESAFVYDFESEGKKYAIEGINPDKAVIHKLLEKDREFLCLFKDEDIESILEGLHKVIEYAVVIGITDNFVVKEEFSYQGRKFYDKNGKEVQRNPEEKTTLFFCAFSRCANAVLLNEIKDSFVPGDQIKFLRENKIMTFAELEKKLALYENGNFVSIHIEGVDVFTTDQKEYLLRGRLDEAQRGKNYILRISNGEEVYSLALATDTFETKISLQSGANYITLNLLDGENLVEDAEKTLIVFRKVEKGCVHKPVIMWVEQYVNAKVTGSKEEIKQLVSTAKKAGITAFALDIKGCEGYVGYRKATLTNCPYITETQNAKKKFESDIDMLEEMIAEAHLQGLKVYGSLNFFVEGNLSSADSALNIRENHPDWAEVLQTPEDGGKLCSVFETAKNSMLLYVNPANKEVQDLQLRRVREVLENYEIDGIILDRTRYDNQFADFSEVTKEAFEAYLAERNQHMEKFPEDIYTFDEKNQMVYGRYYVDWIAFRSGIIKEFARRVYNLLEEYRIRSNRTIEFAAYVGSWFDLYYQNGVNWSGRDFVYRDALEFPMPQLYTKEYAKTSYLEYLDFLMIGCYFGTREQMEKYITIGNIVTNHEVPVIASISLPDLSGEELLDMGVKACYQGSDGIMIFDLCYVDWEKLKSSMRKAGIKAEMADENRRNVDI